jgi:hypothetical protein
LKPWPGWNERQNARPVPVWGEANTPSSILYDDPILLKSQCGRPVPAGKIGAPPPKLRPPKLALNARHAVGFNDTGLTETSA